MPCHSLQLYSEFSGKVLTKYLWYFRKIITAEFSPVKLISLWKSFFLRFHTIWQQCGDDSKQHQKNRLFEGEYTRSYRSTAKSATEHGTSHIFNISLNPFFFHLNFLCSFFVCFAFAFTFILKDAKRTRKYQIETNTKAKVEENVVRDDGAAAPKGWRAKEQNTEEEKVEEKKRKGWKKQNMHFQIIKVFWWENSKFKQPVPTQSIHH